VTWTDHVVLTRFNLPSHGVEGMIRAREGWLRQRVELFETYTIPSVASQTLPLTWLVYLDPESPSWLLERLAPWARRGLFRPVLRASVSGEELVSDIVEAAPRRGDFLVTTNLDNDDGVASDLSARLASVSDPRPRIAIYLTRGLVKSGDQLYLRTDRRNAFCSVRETWDDPVTAWSEYHNELGSAMPVLELGGAPAWLQVVHGNNVSNRVRGRLVAPAAYRDRFAGLLDDARAPSASELVADRYLRRPARELRDGARSAARVAGLRLLGKDRYSRAKVALSAALGRSH
jgi:putative rhamnosyltransferase